MITLNVLPLLEKNGKTKYWLYKQMGMSYQNFSRMIHNETNRSDTKTLKHFVFFSTVPQTICSSLPRDKLSLLKTRCFFSCPFSQKWELFHMKHCKSRLMPGLASEALLSRLTPESNASAAE